MRDIDIKVKGMITFIHQSIMGLYTCMIYIYCKLSLMGYSIKINMSFYNCFAINDEFRERERNESLVL